MNSGDLDDKLETIAVGKISASIRNQTEQMLFDMEQVILDELSLQYEGRTLTNDYVMGKVGELAFIRRFLFTIGSNIRKANEQSKDTMRDG